MVFCLFHILFSALLSRPMSFPAVRTRCVLVTACPQVAHCQMSKQTNKNKTQHN